MNKTYKHSIGYGAIDTVTEYNINVDHKGIIELNKCQGQANYDVHIIATNGVGYSELVKVSFKTAKLSYGVVIKVPIRTIVTEQVIRVAISKTLRVTEDRVIVLTKKSDLENDLNEYNQLKGIMINPNLYYEIAVAPNKNDDVIPPITYTE